MRPANAAVSLQDREKWIRSCNQEAAITQGRKTHDRIIGHGLQGAPLVLTPASPGYNESAIFFIISFNITASRKK